MKVQANQLEQLSISPEILKWKNEIEAKSKEYVKNLNKTQTICYTDENGYWVNKTPDGIITKIEKIKKSN